MSVSVQIGLLMAVATAFFAVVGFLYKHRGAVGSPQVEWRRPVRTSLALFRNRWYVLGIVIAIGSLGLPRRRPRARADLARPVGDRRRPRAADGRRRPAVRPRGHPPRVDRRRPRRARPRLPRRDARRLRQRRPLRLRGGHPRDLPRRRSPPSPSRSPSSAGAPVTRRRRPRRLGRALLGGLRHRDQGSDRAPSARALIDRLRQPARPDHHRRLVRRPHRLGARACRSARRSR